MPRFAILPADRECGEAGAMGDQLTRVDETEVEGKGGETIEETVCKRGRSANSD